jgi:hypothetical protein
MSQMDVKKDNQVNTSCINFGMTSIIMILGIFLSSCSINLTPVPEAQYSVKIIGNWQGTVGDSKETMSINRDGTFVCHIHSTGFIATTLSQSLPGEISGTWKITGSIITMNITGSKNEHPENKIASSVITTFKTDELTLKSDTAGSSSFHRVTLHWYNSNR